MIPKGSAMYIIEIIMGIGAMFLITMCYYDINGNKKRNFYLNIKGLHPILQIILMFLALPIILWVQIIRGILILISKFRYKKYIKKGNQNGNHFSGNTYESKDIMTECEKEYLRILRRVIKPQYTIQPQIPLSSIVNKEQTEKWKTPLELFRTIDFGVLDAQYSVICVIEINDRSHYQEKRIERDQKVKEILQEANIPILTLWTEDSRSDGFVKEEIKRQIPRVDYILN